MSIHRTLQHNGQTYIVVSVDMTTADNIVIAAPITGGRVNRKTGAVVSVAYDGNKQVRLVNPRIKPGLTGAQLRDAVIQSAAHYVRPMTLTEALGKADPELIKLVEKAINA